MSRARRGPIVTIDGPSGAGKSTVARAVAARLGFTYIDTGAMYRGIGWLARKQGVPFREGPELDALLREARLVFEEHPDGPRLFVNGQDVTARIRTAEMGMVASDISAIPSVRRWLSARQRSLGERGNTILEGRDMGTVVFPDADVKIFLTASLEARGGRRAAELRARGEDAPLARIVEDLDRRDRNDSSRDMAPLRKADDAVEIDTSALTVAEVVNRVIETIQRRCGGKV